MNQLYINWEAILDHTAIIFLKWGPEIDSPILYASKNIKLFGYKPADLINKEPYTLLVHPDDLDHIRSESQTILQDNTEIVSQEYRIRTKSGQVRWVNDRSWVIRDSEGKFVGSEGIITDITDLKKAEQELKHSENRLQIIVEKTSDIIFEYDIENETFDWFGQISDFLGVSKEHIPLSLKMFLNFVFEEDRSKFITYFLNRTNFSPNTKIPVRINLTPTKIAFWEILCMVVSRGKQRKIIGSIKDRTAEKMYEREIELRKSMDYIGNLAQGVTHDLNNILTVLMGNLTLLDQDDQNLSKDQIQILNETINATTRAAKEINNLRNFSKFEKGPQENLDLSIIAQHIIDFLENSTDKLIHKFNNIPQSIFFIRGNVNEINQVFLNLATNAHQAIMEKGVTSEDFIKINAELITISDNDLDLKVRNNRIYSKLSNAETGQPYIHIAFQDTGIGIKMDDQYKLFRPFFSTQNKQGQKTTKGLGLAMCFNIIHIKHNGFIQVESKYGIGAIFHIFIPTNVVERKIVENN